MLVGAFDAVQKQANDDLLSKLKRSTNNNPNTTHATNKNTSNIPDLCFEDGIGRWAVNTDIWVTAATPAVQLSSVPPTSTPHLNNLFVVGMSLLPQWEQDRVNRFVRESDRKQALVSRLLQRLCVCEKLNVPLSQVVIERTQEGKPYLKAPKTSKYPNFNFNATHHGSYVALACEPVCCVGIDVMDETYMSRNNKTVDEFFSSFQNNLTSFEWHTIRSVPDPRDQLRQFHRHWAMKEAYVKAHGQGLGVSLDRIELHYVPHTTATTAGTNCSNGNDFPSMTHSCCTTKDTNDTQPNTPAANNVLGVTREPASDSTTDVWVSTADVVVDQCVPCPPWRLHLVYLDAVHVCCVARGPSQNVCASFRSTLDLPSIPADLYMHCLNQPHPPFLILTVDELIARILSYAH